MRSGIHIEHPSHVLGKLVETAEGHQPEFHITGVNWPTRDGTGIRDYIHVWDLARAHVHAVEQFSRAFERAGLQNQAHYAVINLGTGKGVTVRELLAAFERVYGKPVPRRDMPQRPGDVAGAYANADTAFRLLGWKAELSIEQGIADALKWAEVRKGMLKYD
jgi:UDP-glucose 4-epimerase